MAEGTYRWSGGFCMEVSPIPNTIVIFGASGDLAGKKLIPAFFSLYRNNLFHEKSRIIGCARSPMSDLEFRNMLRPGLESKCKKDECRFKLESFLSKISYVSGDYSSLETYEKLGKSIENIESGRCPEAGRVFYLSTPPDLCSQIVSLLGASSLVSENYEGMPWRHVVIEKPFGHDLESAQKLDRELRSVLKERQIYRIDHYLGKETVQNILMLRFANRIFEPVWSHEHIENVQITVAESVGVGHRAGYYEQSGQLRDMFQNHMLEMLSLVAMEMPVSFEADSVRNEKAKLLQSIRPLPIKDLSSYIVRGQYAAADGLAGYTDEKGVAKDSQTETFVAARLFIDNWRWKGVPFYLRSGKRMGRKVSEIAVTFKKIPHSIFSPIRAEDLSPNVLVMNVQPDEGLSLTIQAKQPGPKLCMGSLTMDFKYKSILEEEEFPEAYERLLLDCMLGDQTLFIRNDTIERAWTLLTPVLEAWKQNPALCPLHKYPAGSWGPDAVHALPWMEKHVWRELNI